MSSYSELIKNFERIRSYMREFYVYGFKSREDYCAKSARSYDDERRRIESWVGDYMSFVHTSDGKNVFISVDSRTVKHNPFYNAWKAKSFTDGDVTLHFILFDILYSPQEKHTLTELMSLIDEKYLSGFNKAMVFDESTVRKKLKEYFEIGIITIEKQGRKVLYHRTESPDISKLNDVLNYYSEVAPCGVIGSFLLDKIKTNSESFAFKHHYITSAMDIGILEVLFEAMHKKRAVTVFNLSRKRNEPQRSRIVPLRVFIGVQSGRQYLMAYQPDFNLIKSFRIDYLSNVKIEEPTPRFDELREQLGKMQSKMWGISTNNNCFGTQRIEHVEFTVRIGENEEYIVHRLEREKRIGKIEKINDFNYRFTADVYDTKEMIPWIRTFICRIDNMNFSNRTVENEFKKDLEEMYRMYGIE